MMPELENESRFIRGMGRNIEDGFSILGKWNWLRIIGVAIMDQ
jgi:hypothetical protein